jgi:hypothetical protein
MALREHMPARTIKQQINGILEQTLMCDIAAPNQGLQANRPSGV